MIVRVGAPFAANLRSRSAPRVVRVSVVDPLRMLGGQFQQDDYGWERPARVLRFSALAQSNAQHKRAKLRTIRSPAGPGT